MAADLSVREYEKLARWLGQRGVDAVPWSGAPARLLCDRRRIRYRAGSLAAAAMVVALALAVVSFARLAGDRNSGMSWFFVSAMVVAMFSHVAGAAVVSARERRLGRHFAARVAPGGTVRLTTVLSSGVCVVVGCAATLQVVLVRAEFRAHYLERAWTTVGVVLVCWAVVAVGVWCARTRPVLAVDDVTLAVDDRLRTSDAVAACQLIALCWLTVYPPGYTQLILGTWSALVYPVLLFALLGSSRFATHWRFARRRSAA